jgi:hypothetical protein
MATTEPNNRKSTEDGENRPTLDLPKKSCPDFDCESLDFNLDYIYFDYSSNFELFY